MPTLVWKIVLFGQIDTTTQKCRQVQWIRYGHVNNVNIMRYCCWCCSLPAAEYTLAAVCHFWQPSLNGLWHLVKWWIVRLPYWVNLTGSSTQTGTAVVPIYRLSKQCGRLPDTDLTHSCHYTVYFRHYCVVVLRHFDGRNETGKVCLWIWHSFGGCRREHGLVYGIILFISAFVVNSVSVKSSFRRLITTCEFMF